MVTSLLPPSIFRARKVYEGRAAFATPREPLELFEPPIPKSPLYTTTCRGIVLYRGSPKWHPWKAERPRR